MFEVVGRRDSVPMFVFTLVVGCFLPKEIGVAFSTMFNCLGTFVNLLATLCQVEDWSHVPMLLLN